MNKLIVTISGPSGSGKTSLAELLLAKEAFVKLVTTTSRPMRPGEVDGQDYYFVSSDEFEERRVRGEFVDAIDAEPGKYHYYGLYKNELRDKLNSGRIPIVILDPTGVVVVQNYAHKAKVKCHSVYISAPKEVLESRYIVRAGGLDKLTEYDHKRLARIDEELAWSKECNHLWDSLMTNSGNDKSGLELCAQWVIRALPST